MRIEECQIEINDLEKDLLPKLIGKVFHVTSRQYFKMIIEGGSIIANPPSPAQKCEPIYNKAYGRDRNYVSLFDLRIATTKEIENALEGLFFLNLKKCDDKPVFIFFKEKIISKLIPWTEAEREVGYRKEGWVPYVEAWYPSPLSIENINYVLKVNVALDEKACLRKELARLLDESLG